MNIAICDNNNTINNSIEEMLYEYEKKKRISLDYESFTDYESLISRVNEFDLFIMDYNMSDDEESKGKSKMDGMTFARFLRTVSDGNKGIIFMTAYPDFVYDSFEVRTHRFLVKPVSKEKLFDALDSFILKINENKKILVNIKKVNHVVDTDDIYYIEVYRKTSTIYLKETKIECHKSLNDFEEELSSLSFCKIQRSYIVNVSKIKSYTSSYVILENDKKLTVSPNYCATLCEKYLQFNGKM